MATNYSKKISDIFSERAVAEALSLKPINLKVVGTNLKNKNILDLGCGDGRYSILFAKKGAKVVGIDFSEHMIGNAKKFHAHPNITFRVGNISKLVDIKNNSVDLVFMNLVVPDIDTPQKVEKVFKEIKRVLKKNGRLIFSMIHPLYLSPEQDNLDKFKEFKKENYFKDGYIYKAEALTFKGNKIEFNETHFSLNFISKVLSKNQFVIKNLIESKSVPEKKMFLPKYLVLECI